MAFYMDHEAQIPVHAAVFFADCVSKKAASANVEQVFSGAGSLLADFHAGNLSPELLQAYMFIRHNWQYTFLRPTTEEIIVACNLSFDPEHNDDESGDDSDED
eukprot:gene21779-26198_t